MLLRYYEIVEINIFITLIAYINEYPTIFWSLLFKYFIRSRIVCLIYPYTTTANCRSYNIRLDKFELLIQKNYV